MKAPHQEILFSLVEPVDTAWLRDGVGDPSSATHVMEVDLRRRTIILPGGKFDLNHFLRQVRSMLSCDDNSNSEPN